MSSGWSSALLTSVLHAPGTREVTPTVNQPQDADPVFVYSVDKAIAVNEQFTDMVVLQFGDNTPSLRKEL
jgi:hypothetical protein